MPLPETEVNVEIRNLLIQEWDTNPISVGQEFDTAWISTGWWDEDTPNPQITLSNVSEPTGPNGLASNGGLSSWVDGIIDCNIWVPYDQTKYNSAGMAKSFRWDLTRKIHSIIEENQQGNGGRITRFETGELVRNPEIGDEPPPFRMLLPIGFQYRTAPTE